MKTLKLYRQTLASCSIGVILHTNRVLYTLEKPLILSSQWRGGKPFESCVPFGTYELIPHNGNKYKNVFALVNHGLGVYHHKHERANRTDRYGILIHVANWVSQLEGCIAVGQGTLYNPKHKSYCVSSSALGMEDLRFFIAEAGYTHLEIKPYDYFS